jgi:DNA-binding MarR family transcriptional regulator
VTHMADDRVVRRRPLILEQTVEVGPLAELMTVRLRRVDVLLSRSIAAASKGRNLKSGMAATLALIVANPGISQNEISQATGIDKSAIAGIMNRFEELGWLVRRRSQSDKRRQELYATAAGEAELEQVVAIAKTVEAELLAKVSAEDLTALGALLDRLHDACTAALQST